MKLGQELGLETRLSRVVEYGRISELSAYKDSKKHELPYSTVKRDFKNGKIPRFGAPGPLSTKFLVFYFPTHPDPKP